VRAYHITERDNWPNIRRHGFRLGVAPAYEDVGLKAVFFTLQKPTYKDILYWEDLCDPIAIVVDIPSSYDVWPDESGNEIYPEVDPVYITRALPAKYVKGFVEVRR